MRRPAILGIVTSLPPSITNRLAASGAALVAVALLLAQSAAAQELAGQALVSALREGGYNIYFRHAATDWSRQDKVYEADDWTSCAPDKMRQLALEGRRTASRVGEAMRALRIPVGRVLASPYCRTVETARLLSVGPVSTTTDVMNMRAAEFFGGRSAVAARARQRLSMPPEAGTNTVLVAHGNVLQAASDTYTGEAGAVVFRPDGNGRFSIVARISPEEWTRLAADFGESR